MATPKNSVTHLQQTQRIVKPQSTPPPPERSPTRLVVVTVGRTDVGKVRELNEDQFLVANVRMNLEIAGCSFDTVPPEGQLAGTLLVVADGMGGHPAGEQASALAISSIKHVVAGSMGWLATRATPNEVLNALSQGFTHADATLARVSAEHPEMTGMGTTMTVGFVRGSELFLAHVGDSRAYLHRHGRLSPLTRDHTIARELADAGVVSEDGAPTQWSHVLSNAVGGTAGGSKPECSRVALRSGDRLLFCTDGLTKYVDAADIAAELADADATAAADRLVTRALDAGGSDNVTVVLADIVAR